jgi:hypothetical protein
LALLAVMVKGFEKIFLEGHREADQFRHEPSPEMHGILHRDIVPESRLLD